MNLIKCIYVCIQCIERVKDCSVMCVKECLCVCVGVGFVAGAMAVGEG